MQFAIGKEYSRRNDIHAVFGGQDQGGISTPSKHPFILIFTGKSGEQYGYNDGWHDDEVFLYTGEGQVGDMEFKRGNKAIRDHSINGKDILLFEALGKGKPVRFLGGFSCQSWDEFIGPDSAGEDRRCIQFHLIPVGRNSIETVETASSTSDQVALSELRERALKAAQPSQDKQWRRAPQAYRQRSKAVREYVLARAAGRCELTGRPAPFITKAGDPYLEVHHTRRLSDGGPDDPRFVAAICPMAHREIHFGKTGDELNQKLIEKLGLIEG